MDAKNIMPNNEGRTLVLSKPINSDNRKQTEGIIQHKYITNRRMHFHLT